MLHVLGFWEVSPHDAVLSTCCSGLWAISVSTLAPACVFRDVYRALLLVLLATGFGAPALIVFEKRRGVPSLARSHLLCQSCLPLPPFFSSTFLFLFECCDWWGLFLPLSSVREATSFSALLVVDLPGFLRAPFHAERNFVKLQLPFVDGGFAGCDSRFRRRRRVANTIVTDRTRTAGGPLLVPLPERASYLAQRLGFSRASSVYVLDVGHRNQTACPSHLLSDNSIGRRTGQRSLLRQLFVISVAMGSDGRRNARPVCLGGKIDRDGWPLLCLRPLLSKGTTEGRSE